MTPGFPAAMPHTDPTYEPFGGLKPVVAPVSPLSRTQTDGIGSPMLLVDPVWVSKLELESRLPRHAPRPFDSIRELPRRAQSHSRSSWCYRDSARETLAPSGR